jgi:hypothetical protein
MNVTAALIFESRPKCGGPVLWSPTKPQAKPLEPLKNYFYKRPGFLRKNAPRAWA